MPEETQPGTPVFPISRYPHREVPWGKDESVDEWTQKTSKAVYEAPRAACEKPVIPISMDLPIQEQHGAKMWIRWKIREHKKKRAELQNMIDSLTKLIEVEERAFAMLSGFPMEK